MSQQNIDSSTNEENYLNIGDSFINSTLTQTKSFLFNSDSSILSASDSGLSIKMFILIALLFIILIFIVKNIKNLMNYISSLWIQSNPNQWLVIIRSGKMVKAGIGLKTFIGPFDTIVKFSSNVQRISFSANNVTSQMQGVNITGFAFWSVYRDQDGPFKCYKYMQGGQANANVKAMCQSTLRNLIANSKLQDVMKKRDLLRQNMRKQLQKPLKGWGIWLQGVQITEVKICSVSLFNNLQAQFRMDTQIKAQKKTLQTQQKINQEKQKSQLKLSQITQQNQTKQNQQRFAQQLKRRQQQAKYDQQNDKFQIQKIERKKRLQLERLKNEQEQNILKLQNEQKLQTKKNQFNQKAIKEKIQLDKLYEGAALQKYNIDVMQRIYNKLGVKQIKINQFVNQGQSDLGKLLPAFGYMNLVQNSQ